MDHFLPEIFWHDRQGLLSVDLAVIPEDGHYRIVTGSMQKEIRVWELVFEKCPDRQTYSLSVNFLANLLGHMKSINTVQISPNPEVKMIVSGDSDGKLILWSLSDSPPGPPEDPDLPPNKENWVRQKVIHHDSDVTCIAWDAKGQRVASVGRDNNLLVHDGPTGKRLLSVYNLREFPNGVAWDPLGKLIVTMSTDRKMELIDAVKGTKLRIVYSMDLPPLDFSGHITDEKTCKLFHDDQMLSFKRLPSFSPCGLLVVAPCVHLESRDRNLYGNAVFKRGELGAEGRPSFILPSPRVTFLVRMCPVLLDLDPALAENYSGLPHRVLWLSLTDTAVIFYDSQHPRPIAYVDNIHYNKLTDASWSRDGKLVAVSSLEGYCSFLRIAIDNWGCKVEYVPTEEPSPEKSKKKTPRRKNASQSSTPVRPPAIKVPDKPRTPTIQSFFAARDAEANAPRTPTSAENPPKKRVKLITLDD